MTFVLNNALITPNIGLMFWTFLSFIILLVILGKYAWKPIMNGIKSREQSIEDALAEAKKAREEMKMLKAENENILAEARNEREKILRDAKEIKDKLIHDAKTQAQDEAQKIVNNAKENIEAQKAAAFRELKEEVVNLAIDAATKILKKELGDKQEQEKLVESYLNEVNAN